MRNIIILKFKHLASKLFYYIQDTKLIENIAFCIFTEPLCLILDITQYATLSLQKYFLQFVIPLATYSGHRHTGYTVMTNEPKALKNPQPWNFNKTFTQKDA